jgi:EAL domain-containing protein (putative c-di-GMP-specific phosphodiesterase class I)
MLQEEDTSVDVVILDLMMPEMDGIEFIRHFRNAAPGTALVVASALESALLSSVARVAEAYDVRLLGLLQKPTTPAKLAPMMEALKQGRAGTPVPPRFSLREIADAWTHDEFEPLFEPKVDLASGRVVAMAVVPTWNHPSLGLLRPPAFVPCLAARGCEDEFRLLMLEKAFARCRKWSQQGVVLDVSIDLAAASLNDAALVPRIEQLATQTGVDPKRAVLNFLGIGQDAPGARALESLARLRMRGFGLGLDDPGSRALLDLAPFSELKVTASAGSRRATARGHALRLSIQAARERKIRTVGAGLRSKEDWAMLHALGCDMAQGPFVSEPIAGRAVPRWLSERTAATIR